MNINDNNVFIKNKDGVIELHCPNCNELIEFKTASKERTRLNAIKIKIPCSKCESKVVMAIQYPLVNINSIKLWVEKSDTMEYKGFKGSIEYEEGDGYHGKVLNPNNNDLILYEALRKDFESAVDFYLKVEEDLEEE